MKEERAVGLGFGLGFFSVVFWILGGFLVLFSSYKYGHQWQFKDNLAGVVGPAVWGVIAQSNGRRIPHLSHKSCQHSGDADRSLVMGVNFGPCSPKLEVTRRQGLFPSCSSPLSFQPEHPSADWEETPLAKPLWLVHAGTEWVTHTLKLVQVEWPRTHVQHWEPVAASCRAGSSSSCSTGRHSG